MVRVGIICLANDSGLGAQTRRLTQMIKPYRVLVIDSSRFSKNKTQNWHWYDAFSGYRVDGFPTNREIKVFLDGLTHVLVCENPLNFSLISEAKRRNIKVFIQTNWEFNDYLNNPNLELPTAFLMPSYWKVEEAIARYGNDKVIYLPPPINTNEFSEARAINFAREGESNFLHIIGTLAAHDRNGTLDLLEALPFIESKFTLTIKSQHALPSEYMVTDSRVRYQIGNETEISDLYKGFDALILPRRYGGLSLTANEALVSGLPVIMPDISPNNMLLPKEWLVPAKIHGKFMAREIVDVYKVDPVQLAKRIDWICKANYDTIKPQAFEIGHTNFSESNLLDKYQNLWSQ